MKRITTTIIVNLILALVQTAIFGIIFGPTYSPNLIFALALALVFAGETDLAYFSGISGGIFNDLLTGNSIGLTPLYLSVLIMIFISLHKSILRGFLWFLFWTIPAIYIYNVVASVAGLFSEASLVNSLVTTIFTVGMSYLYNYFKYDQPTFR